MDGLVEDLKENETNIFLRTLYQQMVKKLSRHLIALIVSVITGAIFCLSAQVQAEQKKVAKLTAGCMLKAGGMTLQY